MTEATSGVADSQLGIGKTAFVVSPIGSRLEPFGSPGRARFEENAVMWEEVLEPACKYFGLAPVRADKITETGEIPEQIFTYLRDAPVVIADLSHGNANVMYELGLRHSRANVITVQIGQYATLPFDVATIRTIQFNRTTVGLIGVRDDLIVALRTALQGGGTPLRATTLFSSAPPVTAEGVSVDVARSAAPERSDEELDADEPGILDLLAEGEEAIQRASQRLNETVEQFELIGARTAAAGGEISASDERGGGFGGRLPIAKRLADDLAPIAVRYEDNANAFYLDVATMGSMVEYVLSRLRTGEEEAGESGRTFAHSIVSLSESATESAVGISEFREGVRGVRKLSRLLVETSKKLERGTTRILETVALIEGWGGLAQQILDDLGTDEP